MALQTFTAGQILTAAQVTALQANDYNQTVSTKTANYVLTAADKGTRVVMNSATATTITVNTSLFAAGDSLRLQNINAGATVVTAGTATVTSAGSLSIPQWGGGQLYFTSASAAVYFPDAATGSGLTLVKAKTAFTTTTAWNADSVFTSTYDNYLINIVFNTVASNNYVNFQMRVGGVSATGLNYDTIEAYASGSTPAAVTTTNAVSGKVGYTLAAGVNFASMVVVQPATAIATIVQSSGIQYTGPVWSNPYSVHKVATAYDGIGFLCATNQTGYYTIYGYNQA